MTDRPTAPLSWDERFGELLQRLNDGWRIAGTPSPPSLKNRVGYQARRVMARLLGTQETFNASVVQSINTINTILGEVLAARDEIDRYRESLSARERRMDAAAERMRSEHQELRTAVGVLRQVTQDLTRQVARTPDGGSSAIARAPEAAAPLPASATSGALARTYVGFEDRFRGTAEAIRERLADYVGTFAGASEVLDIGCGRGEFLDLLAEQGVRARGIDVNESMVDVCREKGLNAERADALLYLRQQRAASLGGVFAAQVVEHLEPAYLAELLDAAFAALKPGAAIVLETINPACWFAFFESYIRDITHVRPLHPDTLTFLLVATGFAHVGVTYRAPYPEHEKLQPIPSAAGLGDGAEILNANVEKVNRLLFTHLDYAVVGRRP